MLISVIRHGFVFHEAAHCLKPPFEELSPRAAMLERIRERAKAFTNTILIDFSKGNSDGRAAAAKFRERKEALKEIRNRYNPRMWGDLVQFADEPAAGSPEEEAEKALLQQTGSEEQAGLGTGRVFIAMEEIQERVIAAFGVCPRHFFGRSRKRLVTQARAASMALCREHTYYTQEEIGKAHGQCEAVAARAGARARVIRTVNAAFDQAMRRVEESLRKRMAA